MAISATDVKKLRDMTGAGMMKAKEALEQADGDFDKATDILRKMGVASAAKKSDRVAEAGLIDSYVHSGRIGVLVEVNCETDFVARTEEFKTFVRDVAMHIAATSPQYTNPEDVPEEVIVKEKSFYRDEVTGKPEEIVDKIVAGKLEKFYEGACLTRQPFVKDQDKTIDTLTKELIGKLGENIVIRQFSRLELGA